MPRSSMNALKRSRTSPGPISTTCNGAIEAPPSDMCTVVTSDPDISQLSMKVVQCLRVEISHHPSEKKPSVATSMTQLTPLFIAEHHRSLDDGKQELSTENHLSSQVAWVALPPYLRWDVWERHGYSIEDIRSTLEAFPSRTLCQLAVVFGRDLPKTSVKPCASVDVALQFPNCRMSVVPSLLSLLRQRHPDWIHRPSVTRALDPVTPSSLGAQNSHSKSFSATPLPRIPYHVVSASALAELISAVAVETKLPTASTLSSSSPRSPPTMMDVSGLSPSPLRLSDSPNHADVMDNPTPRSPMTTAMDEDAFVQDLRQRTAAALCSPTIAAQLQVELRRATRLFRWRGIFIVALQTNETKTQVLVCGAEPWAVYVRDRGRVGALAACPNTVLTPAGPFALTAETFWLAAASPSEPSQPSQPSQPSESSEHIVQIAKKPRL